MIADAEYPAKLFKGNKVALNPWQQTQHGKDDSGIYRRHGIIVLKYAILTKCTFC